MEGALAQDLDPRAYARIPVGVSVLGLGYGYTYGGVVTDPTIPVSDINAHISTLSLGVAHIFGMFHKTAQISVNLPWSWATVTGADCAPVQDQHHAAGKQQHHSKARDEMPADRALRSR